MRMSMPPTTASGPEWTITHGAHEARVVAVGGALRTYTHDGADVVVGFEAHELSPAMRGKLLAPWPGRIRDGVWTLDGVEQQLAVSEPERGNAVHGLVLWNAWEPLAVAPDSVTLATCVHPQPGYPFALAVQITYTVADNGLTATFEARNDSDEPAPFGFAAHPYLTVGEARVDEVELTLPARQYLPVDPDRLLPVADPVDVDDQHRLDGRPLGGRAFDTTFTGLRADADGYWRIVLRHPGSGRTTTLAAQADAFTWAQFFSGDALPEPARRRSGLALEPMTCPPDAFNSGEDVTWIAPGGQWSGTWVITPG